MKLKSKGGLKRYKPALTIGTVIEIKEEITRIKRRSYNKSQVDYSISEVVSTTYITFELSYKGKHNYVATQIFNIGDVYPKNIGDRMAGVVTFTQWGGTEFIGTHLIE